MARQQASGSTSPAGGSATTAVRAVAHRAPAALADAGGLVLGAVFGATAVLRRGRPLHPQGVTLAATVTCTGTGSSGVPWLDTAGRWVGEARVSRAIGLPARWPDIHGLALRLPGGAGGVFDLLFASTGDSGWGRFLLTMRPRLGAGPLTTLLPVRSPSGPLLLRVAAARGADPLDAGPGLGVPSRLVLSYAVGPGPWRDVGELALGPLPVATRAGARGRHHDPVVHELPGTGQYDAVRRLREPAYRAARRLGGTA